ncbi:molybdenum ABC transporter ATP-binding protein [Methylosoma difficile]
MLDINIQLKRGEFQLTAHLQSDALVTGLFGPSGAGKSSLLQGIAGLLKPQSGHIAIAGETLFCSASGINIAAHQRRIGFVFQDALLFPHLSVRQNLLYGFRQLAESERRLSLATVVDILEIGALLDKSPQRLSGGEKQRVGLGRALLTSPRLLLLDEPLASLDGRLKQQILPFLLRIRDDLQMPMLYVSHSLPEIEYLTNHVVAIKPGLLMSSTQTNTCSEAY